MDKLATQVFEVKNQVCQHQSKETYCTHKRDLICTKLQRTYSRSKTRFINISQKRPNNVHTKET